MMPALKPVVLHRVWDFLGAEYIRSDIHLALQSHAVEEEFNNWMSHVVIDEYFETVHFYSTSAHPELSGRLQGALNLLDLRYVNKDLQKKCIDLLKKKGVALYDIVYASRPVLFHAVSPDYGGVFKAKRRNLEKIAFQNRFIGEQQRERICRLESLEDRFNNLISMHKERLQTWKTLKSQKEPVHKRMYKAEVFSWEECVDWWGYYYEISMLYEWFMQLEKEEPVHKRMYKGEVFSWEECVHWWSYYYEICTLYEWFMQLEKVD